MTSMTLCIHCKNCSIIDMKLLKCSEGYFNGKFNDEILNTPLDFECVFFERDNNEEKR